MALGCPLRLRLGLRGFRGEGGVTVVGSAAGTAAAAEVMESGVARVTCSGCLLVIPGFEYRSPFFW